MAATVTDFGGRYRRYHETSGANTALTVAVAPGVPFRVLTSTVAYSASPTQTGVTQTLNSGAGSAFDATLNTASANVRYNAYQPSEPLCLAADDSFDVVAPAAGGVITGSISVYVELL